MSAPLERDASARSRPDNSPGRNQESTSAHARAAQNGRASWSRIALVLCLLAACALFAWFGHKAHTRQSALAGVLMFAIGSLCASALVSGVLDWTGVSPDPSRAANLTRAALRRMMVCLILGAFILGLVLVTRDGSGQVRLSTYALGLIVGGCFFALTKAIADMLLAGR